MEKPTIACFIYKSYKNFSFQTYLTNRKESYETNYGNAIANGTVEKSTFKTESIFNFFSIFLFPNVQRNSSITLRAPVKDGWRQRERKKVRL